MSWSVNATGTPAEVKRELARQFSYPTHHEQGLDWPAERETVRAVHVSIEQTLSTFDPAQRVSVTAYGHAGFNKNWETRGGAYQNVFMQITPVADPPAEPAQAQ